jgi:hypothetical protein
MAEHGTFVWNELNTWEPEKAKAFYEAAMGWSFDAMPMGPATYWIAKVGDKMAGGIFPMTSPEFDGIPSHWFAYVEVDDVDARVAKIEAAGGTIVRPAFDVPTIGRIAIVKDPTGAVLGWMTSAPQG